MSDKKYPKLEVRASEEQITRWKRLAEAQGFRLPEFVRLMLDRAADKAGVS
jgi:predicted DNA binding CopG/RHH family protein